jgi:hypothetical protein
MYIYMYVYIYIYLIRHKRMAVPCQRLPPPPPTGAKTEEELESGEEMEDSSEDEGSGKEDEDFDGFTANELVVGSGLAAALALVRRQVRARPGLLAPRCWSFTDANTGWCSKLVCAWLYGSRLCGGGFCVRVWVLALLRVCLLCSGVSLCVSALPYPYSTRTVCVKCRHPHCSPLSPQGDLFQEETYVGRAKDKKPTPYEGGKSDPASRVKLEYRWVLAVLLV